MKPKCGICLKKLKLLDLITGNCPCGGIFCAEHRFADSHKCSFDYKTREQEVLAKKNPIIENDKFVNRI